MLIKIEKLRGMDIAILKLYQKGLKILRFFFHAWRSEGGAYVFPCGGVQKDTGRVGLHYKGLAHICKDGVDSICAGVRELEEHGYIVHKRVRNTNGQLGTIEYTILEQLWEKILSILSKPEYEQIYIQPCLN